MLINVLVPRYILHTAGGRRFRNSRGAGNTFTNGCISTVGPFCSPKKLGKKLRNGRERKSMLSLVCRASGSEQTMTVSARAILAYLLLAPWNREDWKEVQPLSGTEEPSNLVITSGSACTCNKHSHKPKN